MAEDEKKAAVEGHVEEAKKWRRVSPNPEAYATSGGFGITRSGQEWTLIFATRSNMKVIEKTEYPDEVPPFVWARKIITGIQNKRQFGGWDEKRIKGKPGTEDNSVPGDVIKRAKAVDGR